MLPGVAEPRLLQKFAKKRAAAAGRAKDGVTDGRFGFRRVRGKSVSAGQRSAPDVSQYSKDATRPVCPLGPIQLAGIKIPHKDIRGADFLRQFARVTESWAVRLRKYTLQ